MDDVLLLVSRLALVATGVGGALVVLIAAGRRRIAWLPALPAAVILFAYAGSSLLTLDSPAWALGLVGIGWFVGFPLLAATFPDGRFVPRWSGWVVAASAVLVTVDAATGFALRDAPWWGAVASLEMVVVVVAVALRYRRSATTAERERVRWILLGVVVTVTTFTVIQVVDGVIGGPSPESTARANLAGIPLALGLVIASAWPRVGNVDAVFRGVLVVIGSGWVMGGAFAAGVALARWAGQDPVSASGWGAIGVALVAYPAIRLATRVATWLVFRDRLTPDAAVALLGAALEDDTPVSVPERIVAIAQRALGSPFVRLIAATRSDAADLDARYPAGDSSPGTLAAVPVSFRGEVLAMLEAAPRSGESELSTRDRSTLAAIAHHAGPALDGVRALRTATRAQAELVIAREEERRRLRRELHDDLGPALTGLALSAAALAHQVEPLSPPLALAARELHEGIGDAVARSREIAHGLRPAILDDHGLAAAIRERLGGAPDVDLHLGDIDDVPAAVSLATLRIVQEGVANAQRHAAATSCAVSVVPERGGIRIEIVDDGKGMPRTPVAGVGLRSIRERTAELGGHARFSRPPAGGTRISVWLPAVLSGPVAS